MTTIDELYDLKDGTEVYFLKLGGGIDIYYKIKYALISECYQNVLHICQLNNSDGVVVHWYVDKAEALTESIECYRSCIKSHKCELKKIQTPRKKRKAKNNEVNNENK